MSPVRTRSTIRLVAGAACLAMLSAPALFAIDSQVDHSAQTTVVERYAAESTIYFVTSRAGGSSTGHVVADTLSFEPGSRSFEGAAVDFSGREGDFASLSGEFTAEEADSGSLIQGTAAMVSKTNELAGSEFAGVGGAFSVQDLAKGDTFKGSGRITSYDAAAVPELGGADLYFDSTYTITGVDAVNGLATAACAGELEAVQSASVSTATLEGRNKAWTGAGLLLLGLCGFGATSWRRNA